MFKLTTCCEVVVNCVNLIVAFLTFSLAYPCPAYDRMMTFVRESSVTSVRAVKMVNALNDFYMYSVRMQYFDCCMT